jgi:hypothetical protein
MIHQEKNCSKLETNGSPQSAQISSNKTMVKQKSQLPFLLQKITYKSYIQEICCNAAMVSEPSQNSLWIINKQTRKAVVISLCLKCRKLGTKKYNDEGMEVPAE